MADKGFVQGATVEVTGLREVIQSLRAIGNDLADLKDLSHDVGNIVIAAAQVPTDSGELAGTLRAGRGYSKAVVRAGYARRGAYAGVVHYGNPHTGQGAQPFLVEALRRSQSKVIAAYANGINQIIKQNNL